MGINDSLGYVICRTARKIHQHLTEKFSTYEITPEQWIALKLLFENEGISQKDLSEKLEKDPNNVKVMIDKLTKNSFVKRTVNPADRRAFSLVVTSQGKQIVDELLSLDEKALLDIEQNISLDELTLLRSVIAKMEHNLDILRTDKNKTITISTDKL